MMRGKRQAAAWVAVVEAMSYLDARTTGELHRQLQTWAPAVTLREVRQVLDLATAHGVAARRQTADGRPGWVLVA